MQQRPLAVLHHGRQLLQVAYHEQLHAAKGLAAAPQHTQGRVYGIEQVGAYHTDFVDDHEVETAYQAEFALGEAELLAAERAAGHERAERQLEEGVNGHAAGVDGRDARGREHHHTLRRLFAQAAQESGLARTGLAREEQVRAGGFYDGARKAQFFVVHGKNIMSLLVDEIILPGRQYACGNV